MCQDLLTFVAFQLIVFLDVSLALKSLSFCGMQAYSCDPKGSGKHLTGHGQDTVSHHTSSLLLFTWLFQEQQLLLDATSWFLELSSVFYVKLLLDRFNARVCDRVQMNWYFGFWQLSYVTIAVYYVFTTERAMISCSFHCSTHSIKNALAMSSLVKIPRTPRET